MILYHFTCEHSARRIAEGGGVIVPRMHPVLNLAVVWLTFDPHASRDALGLSSHTLGCDRMTYRFAIPNPDVAVPWNSIRTRYRYAHLLEATHGVRPELWYVSRNPQRADPLDLETA